MRVLGLAAGDPQAFFFSYWVRMGAEMWPAGALSLNREGHQAVHAGL